MVIRPGKLPSLPGVDILPLVGVTGKSVSLAPSVEVALARKKLEEGQRERATR